MKGFLLSIFIFLCLPLFSQNKKEVKPEVVFFKDTLHNLVFDSLSHNLGEILPVNTKITKYFKYIGSEPIFIRRAWTGDPHYICEYPQGILESNKVYAFQVCFWHQGHLGVMRKSMGFWLSNGEQITLTFFGKYVDVQKE